MAVDGDMLTRWESIQAVDPQWLCIDLGLTSNITQVILEWEAAYASGYQIQTAAAAAGPWTTIFTTTTGDGGNDTINVTGSGRYVRMNGTARATGYGYSLFEFKIMGNINGNVPPTVTFTAPANNATFISPATVPMTVNASVQGGTITKVDYYQGGTTLIGTSTTSPFSYTWTNVASNNYDIIAKATSNAGLETFSSTVHIVVTGGAGDFWDSTGIPVATKAMMFKFLNRTNGAYPDSQVYWYFRNATLGIDETHTLADKSLYDMPLNSAGRIYFGLGAIPNPANPNMYWDFEEHTINQDPGGPVVYNGNTTRVDGFGLKLALRLHCSDGYDIVLGENQAAFARTRAQTFADYAAAVTTEFQACATIYYPYRISEPGQAGFNAGMPYATYYDSYVNTMWANNGITVPKPGPNGSGMGAYPSLSAAIFRHVGAAAGSFNADGSLKDPSLWASDANFYQAAPCMYYAKFLHSISEHRWCYAFPYDDAGSFAAYASHGSPQYMIVAIGD
jgi:hypothetical protein